MFILFIEISLCLSKHSADNMALSFRGSYPSLPELVYMTLDRWILFDTL